VFQCIIKLYFDGYQFHFLLLFTIKEDSVYLVYHHDYGPLMSEIVAVIILIIFVIIIIINCNWVVTRWHWVLPGDIGCYPVAVDITRLHWMLPGVSGCYPVALDVTRWH
jgi:hypothetical protein